jgi:hypothetical protein
MHSKSIIGGCIVVKKVLALVVFVSICCTLFLPPSVAVAEERLGVFFATRDLDEPWTNIYPSDASEEGYGGKFIVVDSKDSFWHRPCRHCFLLFGRLLEETAGKLLIEVIAARGFSRIMENGKLTKKTEDGDENEWLLDLEKRSKLTVSCTPFVLEGMTLAKKDGLTVLASKDNVTEIWNSWYDAFKDRVRTKNKYHGFRNNCCTAAFESLRQAVEENKDFDLSSNLRNINIRDYNCLGAGVPLDDSNDLLLGLSDNPSCAYNKHHGACDIQKGFVRCVQDFVRYVWRFARPPKVRDAKQLEEDRTKLRKVEDGLIKYTFQVCGMYKDEATEIIERILAKVFFVKASELHSIESTSGSFFSNSHHEFSQIYFALFSGGICKEALGYATEDWFSLIGKNFTSTEMFRNDNWYCLPSEVVRI